MPGSCFAPYTPIATNLLFFDKTGVTEGTWFYRFDLINNQKFSMKKNPITREKLSALDLWWDNREEIQDESGTTWKSRYLSINEIIENSYNLDICGYPNEERVVLDPEETIENYCNERDRINGKMDEKLQQILKLLEV